MHCCMHCIAWLSRRSLWIAFCHNSHTATQHRACDAAAVVVAAAAAADDDDDVLCASFYRSIISVRAPRARGRRRKHSRYAWQTPPLL